MLEQQSASARDPGDQATFVRYRRFHDPADREALVRRYLPLSTSLAARYRHTSEPFEDLRQVASLGLLKAIDRYDPVRRTAFSSFAVPTILGELRRHFRDTTWVLKVPRDVQDLANRLDGATVALERELGRVPTLDELAAHLDTTAERIADARTASGAHRAGSLDAARPEADGGGTLADVLGAEDPGLEAVEDAVTLDRLAGVLGAREREILRLRFREDLRQSDIGERLGISQMHVSRLIRQSLARLEAAADEYADAA
jgi:RNA polymerase sigma-B factor